MTSTTDQSFTGSTVSTIKEASILCPLCGARFNPHQAGTNMCLKCLTTQVDITQGIQREDMIIHYCKMCERYLGHQWTFCDLESKELLAICLKKVHGLNKVQLVDASFVWTEPHSRRIKIKLTVQGEVMNNSILQQSFICEFKVNYKMCNDCAKEFTPHTWGACVQIRQKVDHKKTFLMLEQLILKTRVAEKALKIEEAIDGLDFFFKKQDHSRRLIQFVTSQFPCKKKEAKQFISQDVKSNVTVFKYTTFIDIAQICKDDLVVLTPKFASQLGGWSRLLICNKVSSVISFIDPINMKIQEMTTNTYYQHEGEITCIPARGNMTEFLVNEIEDSSKQRLDQSFLNTRFKPINLVIARTEDWHDFSVRTFLGEQINEGDTVIGYDLTQLNLEGFVDDIHKVKNLPDVVLIKKTYPEKKAKKRVWKLNRLTKNEMAPTKKNETDNNDDEYEEFLKEIEADKDMRAQMILYKDEKAIQELEAQKAEEESKKQANKNEGAQDKQNNSNDNFGFEVINDEESKKPESPQQNKPVENTTTTNTENKKKRGKRKEQGNNAKKSDKQTTDFPIDDLLDEALENDADYKGDGSDQKMESSQQEKIDKFLDQITKVKTEGKKN